jgi:hypothetical protein
MVCCGTQLHAIRSAPPVDHREKHDCIWPWVVIGLAPEMIRGRKCLGTGQTGVTGNVLLARSPKTFTHDPDVHPGMVIPAAVCSQWWDGNNKAPRGNKPPRSQGTPCGAMANGRQCRADRIRNAKNIPLVISDPFPLATGNRSSDPRQVSGPDQFKWESAGRGVKMLKPVMIVPVFRVGYYGE